jgi:predicted RNase H-like nuclease (RuvC/YqgF family)
MIKRILWATAIFALVGGGSAFAQDSPKDVHSKVSKTIATESKAQEKADDWNWQKDPLIGDIRDLKYRITWKQYRQKKYKIYIEGVKESIKDLVYKKEEINKLREQLDPYLETVVDRMAAFVKQDLPFLPEERQKRIDVLKQSLDNYNMQLSEKLNRVFTMGLEIEAQYGKMIEAQEDQTLKLNGVETQVTLMRLGRVEMYYMSVDHKQIGIWNRQTKKWEPLPDDEIQQFKLAFDMALGKRAAQIVELPLGAI